MTAAKKAKSKSAARGREHAVELPPAPDPPQEETMHWHEQAAFHLTLDHAPGAGDATIWRTHVYHEESGEEQTQSGILHQDVIHWIRERAGAPKEAHEPAVALADAPQLAQATPGESVGAPITEPRLSVDELAIETIQIEPEASGAEVKPLHAHVRFAASNLPTHEPGRQTAHYTIEVLACPRASGQAIVLASARRQLAASEPGYAETLEFDLPPLGEYQTLANVVLEDEGLVGAVLGPVLTIVP